MTDQNYFEDGQVVPIVAPSIYFDDPVDAPQAGPVFNVTLLLEVLLTGSRCALDVGERAVLLSFLLKSDHGPSSFRQLGLWLDCNHVTAKKKLTKFQADFIEELRAPLTTDPHR